MTRSPLEKSAKKGSRESIEKDKNTPRKKNSPLKPSRPGVGNDPLKHCRRCEFQEICENVCIKYFE